MAPKTSDTDWMSNNTTSSSSNNRVFTPPGQVGVCLVMNSQHKTRDDNDITMLGAERRFPVPHNSASTSGVVGNGCTSKFSTNNNSNLNNNDSNHGNDQQAAALLSKLRRRSHLVPGSVTTACHENSRRQQGSSRQALSADPSPVSIPRSVACTVEDLASPMIGQSAAGPNGLTGMSQIPQHPQTSPLFAPELDTHLDSHGDTLDTSEGSLMEEQSLLVASSTASTPNRHHPHGSSSSSSNKMKLKRPSTMRSDSVPSRYFLAKTEFSEPTRQRPRPLQQQWPSRNNCPVDGSMFDLPMVGVSSYPNNSNLNLSNDHHDRTFKSVLCSCLSFRFWVLIQLFIIGALGVHVYNVQGEKAKLTKQLQQFEDEQAHILTQMMWVDKQAKKITESSRLQKQNAASTSADHEYNSAQQKQLVNTLQNQIEMMQIRIQDNARTRIARSYTDGEKRPLQVQIRLAKEVAGLTNLVLELWTDDTPHAAWTWLEQVNQTKWDGGYFRWKSQGTLLATPREDSQTWLEFLESGGRRQRQHQDCEVSLAQNTDSTTVRNNINAAAGLSLRINLLDDPPPKTEHVCIGRVLKGLEELHLPSSEAELKAHLPIDTIKVVHKN